MIDKLKFLSIIDKIQLIDKNLSLLIFLTALCQPRLGYRRTNNAMFAKSLRLPSLSPPMFDTDQLIARNNPLSFGCCLLGMLLESKLSIKPPPQILQNCAEPYLLPLQVEREGTELMTLCKQHHFLLLSCQAQSGRLDLTGRSLKDGVHLMLEHGNIILFHNHQNIIGIADNGYPQWDFLLQDVVKGDIPQLGSKDGPIDCDHYK